MYFVADVANANAVLTRLSSSPQERHWEFRVVDDSAWNAVEPILADDSACL